MMTRVGLARAAWRPALLSRAPSLAPKIAARQASYRRWDAAGGPVVRHAAATLRQRPDLAKRVAVVVAVVGGSYIVLHLEKVPETGRWRFMAVSRSTEEALGQQTEQQVLGEYKGKLFHPSSRTAREVRGIVDRIVSKAGIAGEREWRCYVVDEPKTRNAFVLPNGAIFVFSGILPVCKDQNGLAAVLGHEIAHQVARHNAESLSLSNILFIAAFALDAMGLGFNMSSTLLTLFMRLPNSRTAESEADYIGLKLSSAACFDPSAAVGLWERMDAAEHAPGSSGGLSVDFLSTHPASKRRMESIRGWLPEMKDIRSQSCGFTQDHYQQFQSRFS